MQLLIKTEGAIAGYPNIPPSSENMKLFKIKKKRFSKQYLLSCNNVLRTRISAGTRTDGHHPVVGLTLGTKDER